jgi:glycosyltransferase involved in cell wall biosynthesis
MQAQTRRPKLLLVSSYKRQCGIAQYVEHLEGPLRGKETWDIEIAELPIDVLKAMAPHARKMANVAMEEIVRKAREADVVSIQFEPGLFGRTPAIIWKRLQAIIGASRHVILTYHTVPALEQGAFGYTMRGLLAYIRAQRGSKVFTQLFRSVLRNPSKFRHIVQTKREARRFVMMGIPAETIADMPLAFLDEAAKRRLDDDRIRDEVQAAYGIAGKKIIACFGFLSAYKGVEVAIRALPYLPQDYHLFIVGGLHPEGIEPRTVKQPYIDQLLGEITTDFSRAYKPQHDAIRKDLGDRTHFCGALDDDEFNRVMVASDAVVLPYTEVGQTSSGPAAIALDLGRAVYCSRNHCFRELDRYQPDAVSMFEIGNYMELAQKIGRGDGWRDVRVEARRDYARTYNVEARAQVYLDLADSMARPATAATTASGMKAGRMLAPQRTGPFGEARPSGQAAVSGALGAGG